MASLTVTIDMRERDLFEKMEKIYTNKSTDITLKSENLHLGDIVVESPCGSIIIERKTIRDLLASIKDGRYNEQSLRLSSCDTCNHNIVYLIEGFQNLTLTEKQIFYSSLTSLSLFKGFSVIHTTSVDNSAEYIFYMTNKILRSLNNKKDFFYKNGGISDNKTIEPSYVDVIKTVKKDNVTKENIDIIMLMQIPSISATSAKAIISDFGSLFNLMKYIRDDECDITILKNCSYDSSGKPRKIGKNIVENIKKYLCCK